MPNTFELESLRNTGTVYRATSQSASTRPTGNASDDTVMLAAIANGRGLPSGTRCDCRSLWRVECGESA